MKLKNFTIPQYQGAGIYAIINYDEAKIYIGKTSNIKRRAEQHKKALETGTHPNYFLSKDSTKKLCFLVLRKVPENYKWLLNLLEKLYMYQSLDSGFTLYNIQGCESPVDIRINIVFEVLYTFGIRERFEKAISENQKHSVKEIIRKSKEHN